MISISAKPATAGSIAEAGTPGASPVREGDGFMAVMAEIGGTAKSGTAEPAVAVADDLATQMIATTKGIKTSCKAPEAAGDTAALDDAAGETGDDKSGSLPAPAIADIPAVTPALQPAAAPTLLAAAAVPGAAQATPTAVPASLPSGPNEISVSSSTALDAPATQPPIILENAAGSSNQAGAAPAQPAAPSSTMVTRAVSEETTATPAPSAMAAAEPAVLEAIAAKGGTPPLAINMDAAAEPSAPSVIAQLALPGLHKIATGLIRSAARERAGDAAPAAAAAPKAASAAPGFLVSTILPLLPESLHALVLGQSAPGEPASAMAPAAPSLDPAAEMIEQQLDLAHEGEWLDQLAKDIARSAGNEGGLRFRLNPENLGSLHVELTQAAAGASVRMTTDSEAARAIIAEAQPRLIAEARAQGLRIAESHVDLGGQHASGDPRRQGELQQQPRFVRTAAAEPADAAHTPQRSRSAAERYA